MTDRSPPCRVLWVPSMSVGPYRRDISWERQQAGQPRSVGLQRGGCLGGQSGECVIHRREDGDLALVEGVDEVHGGIELADSAALSALSLGRAKRPRPGAVVPHRPVRPPPLGPRVCRRHRLGRWDQPPDRRWRSSSTTPAASRRPRLWRLAGRRRTSPNTTRGPTVFPVLMASTRARLDPGALGGNGLVRSPLAQFGRNTATVPSNRLRETALPPDIAAAVGAERLREIMPSHLG